MSRIVILAAIYMAAAAGLMALQVFLSGRERKWLGLIIPIVFFIIGLLYPLNMAKPADGVTSTYVVNLLLAWIMGNIPTFITLGIYFVVRKEKKREK